MTALPELPQSAHIVPPEESVAEAIEAVERQPAGELAADRFESYLAVRLQTSEGLAAEPPLRAATHIASFAHAEVAARNAGRPERMQFGIFPEHMVLTSLKTYLKQIAAAPRQEPSLAEHFQGLTKIYTRRFPEIVVARTLQEQLYMRDHALAVHVGHVLSAYGMTIEQLALTDAQRRRENR